MNGPNAFDRAEAQLENDYASGAISLSEYNAELRELRRDYRDAAEESAWDAYNRELENW